MDFVVKLLLKAIVEWIKARPDSAFSKFMLKQRGPVRLRSSTLPKASQPIWPTSVISPVGSSRLTGSSSA